MGSIGTAVGSLLVLVVTLASLLLARKANAGVSAFREEHHESFIKRSGR